jgi:c-di-GMP-binding flagellar brake protein YcgR
MTPDVFSGEAQAERRRHPRVPLKLRLAYQCLEKGNVSPAEKNLGKDLAAGGLAMSSKTPLVLNQLLMMTLYLPAAEKREEVEEGQPVNILSRVAWCSRRESDFEIGVQFLDMDRDDRKTMKNFLIDYRLYPGDQAPFL